MTDGADFIRWHLPDWSRFRWTLVLLCLFILAWSGVSLFHTPSCEVLYTHSGLRLPGDKDGQAVAWTVELGNTGREAQDDVRIRFAEPAFRKALVPPSAKNFGISERPLAIATNSGEVVVSLGRLEPEKRVTLHLLLRYGPGESVHAWEELCLGVEPAAGKARVGDPGMTAVGRAWFRIYGDILPL